MPSSIFHLGLKCFAVTLPLVACALSASAADTASPRLLSREVSGAYDMQDGSTVRIDVVGRRVRVESGAAEYWTAMNADLLVSPDGLRSIRLLRDIDGRVDRIEMRIPRRDVANAGVACVSCSVAAQR